MSRGPLFSNDYRPQFSGHETFPLRYGWLKKAYDEVAASQGKPGNKSIFLDDASIALFGVGKNMVSSIRYWAQACNVICEMSASDIDTTKIGDRIFSTHGLDPFMESPSTVWLLHWFLCGRPDRTTWFYAFNHFQHAVFERDLLVRDLLRLADQQAWPRVSAATVKRDVECFVRAYASRQASGASHEEALESPLAELGLLKATGKKDGFRFVRGEKASLGGGVFAFSVVDFWSRFSPSAKSLSFEVLAHEPGAPGRVFALDEESLAQRLLEIEDVTGGILQWSETAGLKQLIRRGDLDVDASHVLVEADYPSVAERRAA